MGSLYERLNSSTTTQTRVKPFAPVSSEPKKPVQTASDRLAMISRDRERNVTISAGTPDPIQERRQSLSNIPVIGQFLTGTGPQGPSARLYPQGSIRQDLVENGIVGFLLEGFQKKTNPTREEVGEQIFTRYEKLQELEKNPDRALQLAIQNTINESPGTARNIEDLKDPNIRLSKEEKEALFWTNTIEDAFAVLDAPVFIGSTKLPKNALINYLKKTNKTDDIIPRLKMVGITDEVAEEVAPKLAASKNEIQIAKLISDAKQAVKDTDKPSLFSRLQERVTTKITPGKTNRFETKTTDPQAKATTPVIKRTDEISEDGTEKFFRSVNKGKSFDEIVPDEVVPAFIREDLDTFVTKIGDEFSVVEGKTGQVLGEPGRTVAEAVQKAKSEVESIGDERLREFISNSPLSPRYTQVEDTAKTKDIQLPEKLKDKVITADQLRKTDKGAARKLAKLENMSKAAPDVEGFVEKSGITKEALDKTVQQQGYKDSEAFFNSNRPAPVSARDAAKMKNAGPDNRVAPDEEQSYSILAEQFEGDEFALNIKKEEGEAAIDNLRAVFAEMKDIELDDALRFTEEDLFKVQTEYEFVMDALMDDPARALSKYANKNGELPEVTGTEFIQSKTGNGKQSRNSNFGRYGDDIIKSLGFDDVDEAISSFEKYKKRRSDAQEVFESLKQVRNSIRLAKQMDNFVDTNIKKLATEFQKNRKALNAIVKAAERAGFRKGVAKGNKKIEVLVERMKKRRHTVSGIKFRYNLSPAEVRKAQEFAQKELNDLAIPDDPRFMTKDEFGEYVKQMEVYARDAELRRNERGIVKTIIEQKELKNTENLREVMNLPPLSQMSLEQMGRYENVLEKFKEGDEFLSKRTLEVIDRTALKGARTMRQVQEFLANEIKRTLGRRVSPDELSELTAGAADYLRWDTSLAESKPFFEFLVNRSQKHMMEGESNFLRLQNRVEVLAKRAKKSRVKANSNKIKALQRELKETTDPGTRKMLKKKMKDLGWRANAKQQFVPTYTRIINYLEARGDEKEMWFKTLTKEEQEYAQFVRNYYNSAYNYLTYINEIYGSRYVDAYFTHVRKGFLEKWTDDGFVSAVKNMWDAQKEDMAIANIIDSDTGKILPKSKFFQYTLKRTGEGEVSQNLTRVFLQYSRLLERKKMLDKMIPELDVYTSSLTPKELTPRGLEMDRTLKEFVNNYLNNKRGRRFNFGGIVKQNGPADIMLRTGNTLVSLRDLGLNFMAGAASAIGEQVTTFIALGNLGYVRAWKRRLWDTGMKRMTDTKSADILKQAEPFIGRNVWTEMLEVDKPIFEKGMLGMFGMFGQSSVEANKLYLLGSMTAEEMKAGKISAQRMADLKLEAGRWRDMGADVKSIVGATSVGAGYTKYKTWALPILRANIDIVSKLSSKLKNRDLKGAATSKEMKELMREIEVTAVVLTLGSLFVADSEDDSVIGQLKARAYREANTLLGGVDPTVWLATPRLFSFVQEFGENLKKIAMLEEYKSDSKYGDQGDLKGVGGIIQQFTPGFIRQFLPNPSSSSAPKKSSTGTKLDDLNRLDKLDGLDKLNKLNKLDKIDSLDSL